jgi:hypothetical protein
MKKTNHTYYLTGAVTAESQLATCGPSLAAAAKKAKVPTPVPSFQGENGRIMYMPGAGFRSKLRGAACALMLEALEERGAKRFSLLDAQLNRVGGIKQGGNETAMNTASYLSMIEANPILGIFGAATPWVKGKSMIGHLTCKNPNLTPMLIDGVRADVIRRDPGIIEYLADGALDEYAKNTERVKAYALLKQDRKALLIKEIRATGEDKKKFKLELAALDKKIKDDGSQEVSAQQPLLGYEAIPPGTELDNKIALVGVSQIELGCFLAAMQRFSENPVLGAHVAHGAGIIRGIWDVQKVGVGKIGSIKIEPFSGLVVDNDELVSAMTSFQEFIKTEACKPYVDLASMMPATAEEGDGNDE